MTSHSKRLMRKGWTTALAALLPLTCATAPIAAVAAAPSFVEFESGHVRPIAMSSDGTKLFAVNTPDNRLSVFNITSTGLSLGGGFVREGV